MTNTKKKKTTTVSFNSDELFLLLDTFHCGFTYDPEDADSVKLQKISNKLSKAQMRLDA